MPVARQKIRLSDLVTTHHRRTVITQNYNLFDADPGEVERLDFTFGHGDDNDSVEDVSFGYHVVRL